MVKIKRIFNFLNFNDWLLLTLLFFGLAGYSFASLPTRKGDGVEYMLATENLVVDYDIKLTNENIVRYETERPRGLDTSGLNTNTGIEGGQYLTQHPIYYSLFSAPLFALTYLFNHKMAYLSFFWTNIIFLCAAVMALIYYYKKTLKSKNYLIIVISFILFSAMIPYVFWQHPEMFIFTTLTLSIFYVVGHKNIILSSIFFGLTIGQSLVLFPFISILIHEVLTSGSITWRRRVNLLFKVIGITILIASLHYVLTFYLTGRFFPLGNFATYSILALKDVWRALIDPAVGIIWFYPMVIAAIIGFKRNVKTYLILGSALVSLTLYMINNQFYTHQVGLRYLNYIYPAFLFIFEPSKLFRRRTLFVGIIGFAAFLTVPINLDMHLSNDAMEIEPKNFIAYKAIKRLMPITYKDHPGVFVYRAESMLNLTNDENKQLDRTKIFVQNERQFGDKWMRGNTWTRLLFNPIKEGALTIYFKLEESPVLAKVNRESYQSRDGILAIPIASDDISHSTKHEMFMIFTDYVYIDLYMDGWCPCDQGINDYRILGNSISKIENNDMIIYESTK